MPKISGSQPVGLLVLTAALALVADLWEVDGRSIIEPTTVLTIALVGATLYYAIQNRDMAASLRTQVAQASQADTARQREAHILDVQPFLAAPPEFDPGRREAKLNLHVRGRPALHLTASVRAMAEAPDPGSVDGRSHQGGGLGSLPPGSKAVATLPLSRFFTSQLVPFEDVWEVEVTYDGTLGQRVVETYEWRIADFLASKPPSIWQLRRFQIVPKVPDASSLDLRFGDE